MKKQSLSLFRRGGLASKLFSFGKNRRARRASREARSSTFRFESLESRMMMDGAAATSLPTYDPNSNFHIHFDLWIWANGQRIHIPAHVGDTVGIHTHEAGVTDSSSEAADLAGDIHTIHVHPGPRSTYVKLDDFLAAWRTDPDVAERNANASVSATQMFGNTANNTSAVRMFVNGERNTEFGDYLVKDGDAVVLVYGSNPVVTVNTNFGTIPVELFSQATPITVDNFLDYANAGDYNGSFFHRYVPGFVMQGGGFSSPSNTFTNASQFTAIPTNAQIQNEFGISNKPGTIAMAKLGGNPNSATNQFFINLADNASNLDNQNGGFTVFGQILDRSILEEATQFTPTNAQPSVSGGVYSAVPMAATNQLFRIQTVTGEGSVRGTYYKDTDKDGTQDTGEVGIAGVTIFADANNNGVLDSGEVTDVTDSAGDYGLFVQAGQYTIRAVAQGANVPTGTSASGQTVIVQMGSTIDNIDFGAIPAQVKYRYEVTDVNGNALTGNIDVGTEFLLRVYVQDLRATAPSDRFGVFAAYEDVVYDATRVTPVGNVTFVSPYINGQSSSSATSGLLDEVGSFQDGFSPLGRDEILQFTQRFRATRSGAAVFSGNGPDVTPLHNILLMGQSAAVPTDEVTYGTATVTVNSAADPKSDSFNFDEDSTNRTLDVLANDGPAGTVANLTILSVTAPSRGGTVTRASDNKSLIYTPLPNFFGEEVFTYTATDGDTPYTATAVVQVAPVNDTPDAVNDTFNVNEDSTSNLLDVLGNDLIAPDQNDPNEALRVTAVGTSAHGGTVTKSSSGTHVLYTPAANFTGVDTFTYTVGDRSGSNSLADTATATVTVSAVNDPPIAGNDSVTVVEDSDTTEINVLTNDNTAGDPNETVSLQSVTQGNQGGTVTLVASTQRVQYKPKANFTGTETFTYTINDGNGGTAIGTVTATVTNVNDPPTAVNDSITVVKEAADTVVNVLANDTFAPDPAESLSVTAVTQGTQQGIVTLTGGQVKYRPKAGFTGTETFTYTISDGNGGTATGTVSVEVKDYIPSNITGNVYMDLDGDGVKDTGEQPIAGVAMRLQGTDSFGVTVNRTTSTAADGTYFFRDLAPGNYTVVQTQPAFLQDGVETAGTGGTVAANDQIAIQLAQNVTASANNFAERGRAATFVRIRDLFASTPVQGMLTAISSSGDQVWTSFGRDWPTPAAADVSLDTTLHNLEVNLQPTSTGSFQMATIPVTSDKVQFLGYDGSQQLYRVIAPYSALTFQPVTTNNTTTNNGASGEGEANLQNSALAASFFTSARVASENEAEGEQSTSTTAIGANPVYGIDALFAQLASASIDDDRDRVLWAPADETAAAVDQVIAQENWN